MKEVIVVATPHEEARREFNTLASEIAARIVKAALPKLKQKYDAGAKRPRIEVTLPSSVSRQLYDKAGSDLDLIDEIGLLIYKKARKKLKAGLGKTCKSVEIYKANDGAVTRGDKFLLSVTADFA